ncbi:hypothetical protein IV38_GL000152 [Lactobacillus selangorensis]|uniref:Uncharacterized protein n=2 Tax=Lactobacillus selangorensis TaxID=81857 RepID=A0A0R2FNK4_9LACO|nr:hypothetical protein IV38_GL000152 [Lactobacillus selangorensis]KRN34201.1 hypothetical protein IV40_GL000517 [Lactobacillus selangorensis]
MTEDSQTKGFNKKQLYFIRRDGSILRRGYKGNNVKKADGIAIKLLDYLRVNNRNQFMNLILNSYMYVGETVPSFFNEVFQSDEVFQEVGLAFVTGLLGGFEKENATEA